MVTVREVLYMNFDELVRNAFDQEASGIVQTIEKQEEILNNILLQGERRDNRLSKRMRERMKLGFMPVSLMDLAGVLILIAVIFAIPTVINYRNMKAGTEQQESSINTPNQNLMVSKEIEDTISDYLVVKYKDLPTSLNKNSSKVFETHKIYSTEVKNNNIYVYLYALVERFEIADGKSQVASGVSMPMTLVLQESNSKYSVTDCKEAISGSDYADSIRRIFPSIYAEQAINDTGHVEELIKQINKKADEWVKNEVSKNNSLPSIGNEKNDTITYNLR